MQPTRRPPRRSRTRRSFCWSRRVLLVLGAAAGAALLAWPRAELQAAPDALAGVAQPWYAGDVSRVVVRDPAGNVVPTRVEHGKIRPATAVRAGMPLTVELHSPPSGARRLARRAHGPADLHRANAERRAARPLARGSRRLPARPLVRCSGPRGRFARRRREAHAPVSTRPQQRPHRRSRRAGLPRAGTRLGERQPRRPGSCRPDRHKSTGSPPRSRCRRSSRPPRGRRSHPAARSRSPSRAPSSRRSAPPGRPSTRRYPAAGAGSTRTRSRSCPPASATRSTPRSRCACPASSASTPPPASET